jgi:hypothetical protein
MEIQLFYNARNVIGTILLSTVFLSGCEKQGYSVLAATGTVIGVEVSQNPATQSPQAKLGYNRAELAFVPTNRSGNKDATGYKNGATDTGEVIMELRYGGIFDTGGSSGIYQRLAVGKTAVQQPGAKYMFAKDEDGTLSPEVAKAIALDGIKTPKSNDLAKDIVDKDLTDQDKIDTMKRISAKDYATLTDEDFGKILTITGLDRKNYTAELHQAISDLLNK